MSVTWHVAHKPNESEDFEVWWAYIRGCPHSEFEMCVASILAEYGARLHLPEDETPFYNFEYRFSDGPFSLCNAPNPFDLSSRLGREMRTPVLHALTEDPIWTLAAYDRNLFVWVCSVARNSGLNMTTPCGGLRTNGEPPMIRYCESCDEFLEEHETRVHGTSVRCAHCEHAIATITSAGSVVTDCLEGQFWTEELPAG